MSVSDTPNWHTMNGGSGSPTTHAFPLTRMVNLLVWLTFALSSLVLMNPAPVDALMFGLIIALPLSGMTRFSPMMFAWLALMLIITAGGFLGVNLAIDKKQAMMHMVITLYLSLSGFVLAGYIAYRPHLHLKIIMNAYTVAALIAVLLGLAGYFNAFPGAFELFTKFDRVKGAFKDPNVFGPFLIPPILYAIHQMLTRKPGAMFIYAGIAGFLSLGVLLSFSRGAWLHLALSASLFAWFTFMFSNSIKQRIKLTMLIIVTILGMVVILLGALQVPKIAELLEQRASMTQSYDTESGGRFAGHVKARKFISEKPLGIGPIQFGGFYHQEDVHNVYYSMFLSMGWLGGFAYLALVIGTLWTGFMHLFKASSLRPYMYIAMATFIGLVAEGLIIDSDHWRHFYVVMAMIWGIIAYDNHQIRLAKRRRSVEMRFS